jgi:hypothetical protein
MLCFIVCLKVLCEELSCDLSDLVKIYIGKYPINPLRGVGVWLICCVLGCSPSVVVETIVAVLVVLCVPSSVPVMFSYLFFRGVGPVTEFYWVVDCKRYNCVIMIKVNIQG